VPQLDSAVHMLKRDCFDPDVPLRSAPRLIANTDTSLRATPTQKARTGCGDNQGHAPMEPSLDAAPTTVLTTPTAHAKRAIRKQSDFQPERMRAGEVAAVSLPMSRLTRASLRSTLDRFGFCIDEDVASHAVPQELKRCFEEYLRSLLTAESEHRPVQRQARQ